MISYAILDFKNKIPSNYIFQPKPQFQSSSGQQNSTTSTASTAKPAAKQVQPLSYAEYIVQSKSNVAAVPQRDSFSQKLPDLRTEGAGLSGLKQGDPESSCTGGGCETDQDYVKDIEAQPEQVKKSEETLMVEGNFQKSDPSLKGPKPVGSGSSIIVSPRQVNLNVFDPHKKKIDMQKLPLHASSLRI